MICERCGNELAASTQVCPACGTRVETARARAKLPTSSTVYGHDGQKSFGEPLSYERGYSAQSYPRPSQPQPQPLHTPVPHPPAPPPGYSVPYQVVPPYLTNVQINVTMMPAQQSSKDGALAAEIILSLVGLFGVGWLIAGETTVGIILLVCSVFIYWPIFVGGTIVSDGIGLICLGPMAIAAIIINAILLNRRCSRKMAQYVVMQQPTQQPPYQPPPIQHYPQQ